MSGEFVVSNEELCGQIETFKKLQYELNRGKIDSQFEPEVVACNYQNRTITFRYRFYDWMLNSNGVMNGGMAMYLVEGAMGWMASSYLGGKAITPGLSMYAAFLNPVTPRDYVLVKVKLIEIKSKIIFARGELVHEDEPEKVLVSVSGELYRKAIRK